MIWLFIKRVLQGRDLGGGFRFYQTELRKRMVVLLIVWYGVMMCWGPWREINIEIAQALRRIMTHEHPCDSPDSTTICDPH